MTFRAAALGLAALVSAVAAVPALAQAPAPTTPSAAAQPVTTAQVATAPAKAPDIVHMAPTPGIGQPTESIMLQPQVTAIGKEAVWFHNWILVPMMAIVSGLVLVLLLWVIVRYRASANPIPSKTHHNTVIEVIWTLAPVLALAVIAIPSIRLLAHQYSPPKADLTVKAIGNQWYWTYQYPDNGDFEIVSNMLPEAKDAPGKRARTEADGPEHLAVDERMVVPAGATVKVITTSNDVIHAFSVPAFWVKMDAVPGRLNETWFKVDRPGVYFGDCQELCGARHAYMPIAVEVVPPAVFAQWVAAKGGTMKGGGANPDATKASSPAVAGTAAVPAAATATPVPGTGAKPPVTSQPAVAQNQGANS